MALPIVAVVGRPNVGKSTFVNRITQTTDAIVHEMRGVTRDRSYHHADWNGVDFLLIDTGGIESGETADEFQSSIRSQAFMATEEADAIVLIVDGKAGLTPEDEEVARILKKAGRPTFLAVNKMDTPDRIDEVHEFWALGLDTPWPVSATHGHGTGDILDEIVKVLPETEPEIENDTIDIAIIGRPNAGKSTLLNKMTGVERAIVSDVPGTTRDAIDMAVERDGVRYRLVDTAGIRRKALIEEDVEYYGFVRAMRAIDRAQVALLVIDSTIGLTDQDQRVANFAAERGCAMVILLNKWDALETPEQKEAVDVRVAERLGFVGYAPVLKISALTGRGVSRIWDAVDTAYANYTQQISTSQLNKLLTEMREFGHTVSKGKQTLRLHYVTQTRTAPPGFTYFANHPTLVDDNFKRYLENRMREHFEFTGTPIILKFRKRNRDMDWGLALRIGGVTVVAYLLGGISWALIIGQRFYGVDVREFGSGNLGATNVLRALGIKAAIATFVLDAAKGSVAAGLAWVAVPALVYGDAAHTWAMIAAVFAVVLGHSYSPYIKFRGGKGIATAAGALLVFTPYPLLILLAVFVVVVAFTRIVSLGSVIAALGYPILCWVFYPRDWAILIFACVATALVVWRHHANIVRIYHGEEPKIDFSSRGAATKEKGHP